jgi:hypothetical protein
MGSFLWRSSQQQQQKASPGPQSAVVDDLKAGKEKIIEHLGLLSSTMCHSSTTAAAGTHVGLYEGCRGVLN